MDSAEFTLGICNAGVGVLTLAAAVWAGWSAFGAFRLQGRELKQLMLDKEQADQDRRDLILQTRRANGPYFKIGTKACDAQLELIGGNPVAPKDYIPSSDYSGSIAGKMDRQTNGGCLYLLVKNFRPESKMVEAKAYFLDPPTGLSENLRIYKVATELVMPTSVERDYWVIGYCATAQIYQAAPVVAFKIKFETENGSVDIHTYKTAIGQIVLERSNPEGLI
jgi:hypothetical protein